MKKRLSKKTIKTGVIATIILFILVPAAIAGLTTVEEKIRLFKNTTSFPRIIYTQEGDCYSIQNFSPTDDFLVPNKTMAEWNTFKVSADDPSTDYTVYPCELPNTECRLWYQYKIDNKIGEARSTPWTNNTTSYSSGPYSITKTGKDDTCNGSQGCGIRMGVQCYGDYAVNVSYEMLFEGVSGGARATGYPATQGTIQWGAWSQRVYETGDSECSSPGCQIRMSIANNYTGNQTVTCGIGYQHRDEQSQSGWRYNNTLATVLSQGSEGENCEGAGCGLQARLYCSGPPEGVDAPNSQSVGTNDGQCGSANGNIYAGGSNGLGGSFPPTADRCNAGSVSGYGYNFSSGTTPGNWSWTCLGTSGGQNDSCVAFNSQDNWNPLGDPDYGQDGCPGTAEEDGTFQPSETFIEGC